MKLNLIKKNILAATFEQRELTPPVVIDKTLFTFDVLEILLLIYSSSILISKFVLDKNAKRLHVISDSIIISILRKKFKDVRFGQYATENRVSFLSLFTRNLIDFFIDFQRI